MEENIATIAATTWTGWRRFIPLACFPTIIVTFVLADLAGSFWYVASPPHVPWILVGYALLTTENTAVMQPAPA